MGVYPPGIDFKEAFFTWMWKMKFKFTLDSKVILFGDVSGAEMTHFSFKLI